MRFTRQLCDGMSQIFKLELLNEFQTTLSGIIYESWNEVFEAAYKSSWNIIALFLE